MWRSRAGANQKAAHPLSSFPAMEIRREELSRSPALPPQGFGCDKRGPLFFDFRNAILRVTRSAANFAGTKRILKSFWTSFFFFANVTNFHPHSNVSANFNAEKTSGNGYFFVLGLAIFLAARDLRQLLIIYVWTAIFFTARDLGQLLIFRNKDLGQPLIFSTRRTLDSR